MQEVRFRPGEVIFKEWTLGDKMYEIKSGSVGIYANYGCAEEKKLTELAAGRILGELSVIDLGPRSATAVAISEVVAEEIVFDDLRGYFTGEPDRVVEIMCSISCRLRELTDDYMEVCGAIRELDAGKPERTEKDGTLLAGFKRFLRDYAEAQTILARLDGGAAGNYGGYYGYYI